MNLNINYDQAAASLTPQVQKNGNITQLTWQVRGKPEQTYGYTYDFLDRLTEAKYGANNNAYGTTYSYDLRGNFTNITRRGVYNDGNGFLPQSIDVMNFTPVSGSNKIESIADNAPCPANKLIQNPLDNTEMHAVGNTILADNEVNDGANITYQAGTSITLKSGFHAKAGTSFAAKIDGCPQDGYETDGFVQRSSANIEYDCEGNRTRDHNKGITIAFNYLNQPYQVTWDNGNTIEWLYDGAGTKLQQLTKRGGEEIGKLDYVDGGIEYERDTLARVYLSDAKVNFEEGVLANYSYFLKDHLMSSRVVFEDDGSGGVSLLSEHHTYPFGLPFKGDFAANTKTKRLYNFKEEVSDFGLGWSDFGFRYYLGNGGEPVFLSVDPIADRFAHVSTYNYAENSPIANIDLHGLQAVAAPPPGVRPTIPRTGIRPGSTRAPANWRNPSALDPQPILDAMQKINSDKGFGNMSGGPNAAISAPNAISDDPILSNIRENNAISLIQSYYDDEPGFGEQSEGTLPFLLSLTDDGYQTSEDDFNSITLFRGVHAEHPDLPNAKLGVATPWGGHDDPVLHNLGDNQSNFTSWTRIPTEANKWARRKGAGGIILIKQFHVSELVPSPNRKHGEGEILIRGTVSGALPKPAY